LLLSVLLVVQVVETIIAVAVETKLAVGKAVAVAGKKEGRKRVDSEV
jgi:hypothetical protein